MRVPIIGDLRSLLTRAVQPITSRLRYSRRYLRVAAGLFVIEALIGFGMHDDFVRPLVGDALCVVLLYVLALGICELPRVATALSAFAIACTVEVAQYFQLVARLGLEHVTIARVIIGTQFDQRDFVAYACGLVMIAIGERTWFEHRAECRYPDRHDSNAPNPTNACPVCIADRRLWRQRQTWQRRLGRWQRRGG